MYRRGLDPDNLNIISPLAKQFPDLSIDAENNLRDKNDNLELSLAKDYIYGALKLFGIQ